MSKPTTLFLEEMTTPQVEAALERGAPLFFPVGTLEAHGRHLPVGTDTLAAVGIARKLAERCRGVVAPPMSYGLTNLLVQTAPASHYDDSMYAAFLAATLEAFVGHGFSTIIIVNGHGGNRGALKQVARQLVREQAVSVAVIHWWMLTGNAAKVVYGGGGGHAAVEETAAVLHFHPDMVDASLYQSDQDDFTPEEGMWCYPPPGEVLLYDGDHKGRPDFDAEKAGKFMHQVIGEIELRLRRWLSRRHRLGGSLRPRETASKAKDG